MNPGYATPSVSIGVHRWFLCCTLALAGCAEPEPPVTVHLIIDCEPDPPTVIDEILVDATASRTEAGATCSATSRTFPLLDRSALPIRLDFVPPQSFDAWVAVRVAWRRAGADVAILEVVQPLGSSRSLDLSLSLESACLRAACGTDLQCSGGACVPFPSPDPFNPALIDRAIPCESGAGSS
ncbi:MAG: hypothetical protein HY907_21850 [Deltaproteobacteria bacterium]|nr:hypothetical protein [Deltaproteobacteria bacterium]